MTDYSFVDRRLLIQLHSFIRMNVSVVVWVGYIQNSCVHSYQQHSMRCLVVSRCVLLLLLLLLMTFIGRKLRHRKCAKSTVAQ